MNSDYYAVLGVPPSATDDEIKRAFRARARELHPDANPGNAEAEARFKELSVAYETLSNPERRRRYDMFGPEGAAGGRASQQQPMGDVFGLGDLFDAFFGGEGFQRGGGQQRGFDAEVDVALTLQQAAFGAVTPVEVRMPVMCERCDGSGCEPGTHPSRCDVCGGAGQVRQVRRSILGQMVTAMPCNSCAGTGSRIQSPCRDCRGDGRVQGVRHIDVEVPAGVDEGQRLRLAGRGPAAPRGGLAGDLYVTIAVTAHPRFERVGDDLVLTLRVPVTQAVLGVRLQVDTLEEPEELIVPPGTQPGRVFKLKGRGVQSLHGRGRGDLLVRIEVEVPEKLRPEEEELLRQWAELRGDDVAPADRGFLRRVKSAFQ